MKPFLSGALFVVSVVGVARAAAPFDQTMAAAAADYRQRSQQAAAELNQSRARIADQKAPLLQRLHAAEERIVAAEAEITRLETVRDDSTNLRRKLMQDLDVVRRSTTYVVTLAHDSLKTADDGLAPGEDQVVGERLLALQKPLDDAATGSSARAAMDAMDFLYTRVDQSLGGYRATGTAVTADTHEVVTGTFAFVGPETFFQASRGGAAGTVRPHEGAKHPVVYALPEWKPDAAAAIFSGNPGLIMADASSGKALRLNETRGSFWQHIQKGGAVAFVIVGVGLVALLMIAQKLRELRQMRMDNPTTIEAFLNLVATGEIEQAKAVLATLKRTTHELFAVGLRNFDQPTIILEQRLQAVLLEQRLHYERRLPLLAVIATAAPLMGLLGTVVGMVKTFALITVFGTGNAGKLSGGISEVLVATELGLAVAIPTLVVHGFLSQRVHRNLALLERFALQFVTAVQAARTARGNALAQPVSS